MHPGPRGSQKTWIPGHFTNTLGSIIPSVPAIPTFNTMAVALAEGRSDLLPREPVPASPPATARRSPVPRVLPPLPELTAPPEIEIIDIRSSHASLLDNLDTKILEGLTQLPGQKFLPSLLIWDEKGQMLYDDILVAEDYYPYRVENELLKGNVDGMARSIAAPRPDLLIELGAGNMSKTAQLLSSLDRYLDSTLIYYALDVDRARLEKSLFMLKDRATLRWIKIYGLLGTYDEGAAWLSRAEAIPYRKALLWLGSSIANFEQHEASKLLASFAKHTETGELQNLVGLLVLTDGCQDGTVIERAYNISSGESRRWLTYAIEAARRHLRGGGDSDDDVDRLLADGNWKFEGQWHPERQRYQNYLVPTRQLVGRIQGHPIHIEEGERVTLLHSGKWTKGTLSRVGRVAGLEVGRSWHNVEFDYGMILGSLPRG